MLDKDGGVETWRERWWNERLDKDGWMRKDGWKDKEMDGGGWMSRRMERRMVEIRG